MSKKTAEEMESTFSLVVLKNSYLADTGSGKTISEQVFASGSLLYRSAKEEIIMLSNHKKAWSDTYFYAQKILSEKTTDCIIPTIWHAVGKGKTTETIKKKKKSVVAQALGGEKDGWIRGAERNSQDSETILYIIIKVNTWHKAHVKIWRVC